MTDTLAFHTLDVFTDTPYSKATPSPWCATQGA